MSSGWLPFLLQGVAFDMLEVEAVAATFILIRLLKVSGACSGGILGIDFELIYVHMKETQHLRLLSTFCLDFK